MHHAILHFLEVIPYCATRDLIFFSIPLHDGDKSQKFLRMQKICSFACGTLILRRECQKISFGSLCTGVRLNRNIVTFFSQLFSGRAINLNMSWLCHVELPRLALITSEGTRHRLISSIKWVWVCEANVRQGIVYSLGTLWIYCRECQEPPL